MLRAPAPPLGRILDSSFAEHLAAALTLNDAVHDGAVMFGRENAAVNYRVTGWSYRLFPPEALSELVANRGSAFNSCLSMSSVPSVDRLYLVTRHRICRFENGSALNV
jgi:hypothetical protein